MDATEDSSIMRVVKTLAKTKVSNLAINKLEQLANKVGVEEKELFQLYLEAKNNSHIDNFASTSYDERIILLPRCIRDLNCPAKIGNNGYECKQCGKCDATEITKTTKKLGYKGTFMLPGGSLAKSIISKMKPKAVIGVACAKELIMGICMCEKSGVFAQGVELLKDGCINTIVDMKTLMNTVKTSKI
ncbi:MAG: DUF116 domain-containing protein [Candidatus Bathyarchaeota archaeon]|nr:DUF116 domain-containing protein [Candidatus Bathyarchaeum tardum]WNZ28415.1 MAG: DUF116 domain-containing protein [Candidatus Bathyarchaeota archaeon]